MNIDIRDIDPEFESDLKDIMNDNNIATASKAVRFIVTNYKSLVYEKESLKKKLLKEEEKTGNWQLSKIRLLSSWHFLRKIMTGIVHPDINPGTNYPVIFFAVLSGSVSGRKIFHVKK